MNSRLHAPLIRKPLGGPQRVCRLVALGLLLFAATLGFVSAQAPQGGSETLWLPQGYRLLTPEERQSTNVEELKAIQIRNRDLLERALRGMSAAERDGIIRSLARVMQTQPLKVFERQYANQVSMQILAIDMEEREAPKRQARKQEFEKLLTQQEDATKGFASDLESVKKEAEAILLRIGREDNRALYLRALKPLRARPWNDSARTAFRKLVAMEPSHPDHTSLYDAGLAFVRAREKDSPDEGAWYSMEAYLRMAFRAEMPEARRLFEIAIRKNANDLESRLFPLLLAEIDGNVAEVRRLRQRAAEAYSKPEDLDTVLLLSIQELPEELAVRARETFGRKYKAAHPAGWPWRVMVMEAALLDGLRKGERGDAASRRMYLERIDQEAGILRALPAAALPEPSRSAFVSLQLRARAGLGRCEEVSAELGGFEREAQAAYPARQDDAAPPPPRTAADVRSLRGRLQETRVQLARLKAAIADKSITRWPEFARIPAADRIQEARELMVMIEDSIAETEELLRDPDDARVAAEWSRREHAAWEARTPVARDERAGIYDAAGRAERLSILVRASQGRCLLERGQPAEAVRVLQPCAGGGYNFHIDCVRVLSDAGIELAQRGDVRSAVSVYDQIGASGYGDELFGAIDRVAPGTVKRASVLGPERTKP